MTTAFFSLRAFREEDLAAVQHLFRDTVWHVNCRDFTPAQLAAWAPETFDASRWLPSLLEHHTLLACANDAPEQILGFADMAADGYLDRLYVHKDFQHRGIGTGLVFALECWAAARGCTHFEAHVSITARPFFAARGYVVQKEQQVERLGQTLTNYVMRKEV